VDKKRKLIYFRKYFLDFFNQQNDKTKDKIDYVLFFVTVADKIPGKFLNILKAMMDYLQYALNSKVTFIGYFVASIKEI
jgi:hypothetical protein